ncbi:hypothetical protein OH77DRAFT_1426608 [Trametes cingulata]|nr:hypothetical protein OH77DRAFT_1426608 [Trametes cingulata]
MVLRSRLFLLFLLALPHFQVPVPDPLFATCIQASEALSSAFSRPSNAVSTVTEQLIQACVMHRPSQPHPVLGRSGVASRTRDHPQDLHFSNIDCVLPRLSCI